MYDDGGPTSTGYQRARSEAMTTPMADESMARWVQSIDATYELVRNPDLRAKYPVLAEKVASALEACESALHDYGVNGCALSFNGGKDCTVLAHILCAALRKFLNVQKDHKLLPPIRSLYVACKDPFPEVEAFISYASSQRTGYNLQLQTAHGALSSALGTYINGKAGEGVRAMFIGIRHDDPHGSSLQVRSPCDPSWPPIMRVHPILDWNYTDIWSFLRCPVLCANEREVVPPCVAGQDVGVPYCILYDYGYTSLGNRFNTIPNPELLDISTNSYKPAYRLCDGAKERFGRLPNSTSPQTS